MEEPTKPDSGTSADANNDNDRKKQGRGNSRGGYKGRRGNQPKGTGTIYRKPEVAQKEKFTGRSDDLEGYVYTLVSSKGGVQFTRTTEEVARYAGEKYSIVGAYVRTAILTMTEQVPMRPTAPTPQGTPPAVDPVDQAIFSEEIRQFVRNKAAIIAAMKAV
jgi:transcription elongation factor